MALTIAYEGKGIIANADGYTDTGTSGSTWNEDGAGSDSFTTDTFLFGTQCFAGAYSNKAGFQYFDIGSGNELDFTATTGAEDGQFIWIWINCPTIGLLDTKANNGLSIRIGSSLTDYQDYLIAGSDDANGWLGDWKCFVLDPQKTATSSSGTFDISSVRYIGVWIDTKAIAKGDNIFIDQIAVGTGLRITGTSTTGWKDVADYCTDYSSRAFGSIFTRGDTYFAQGKFWIGDATSQSAAVSFADSGRSIEWETSQYWSGSAWVSTYPSDGAGVVLEDHSSYTTTYSDGVSVGTDNGRSGSLFKGNADQAVSFDLYGGNNAGSLTTCYGTTFNGLYGAQTVGNDADFKFFGCSWVDCEQFNPVGAPQIRNCLFADTAAATTDAALLWNDSIDVEDTAFIANARAIEITSTTATQAFEALSFSGNTYDVHLNNGGTSITVNKNGGSDPSTYIATGGGTVTFSATFTHVLEGLESGTEVTYVTADTSTQLFHVESASTSDGNGKYKTTYTHSGGASVDILLHHVSYQPDVSNIYGLTLPNSNAVVKVQMFLDLNYANP